MSPVVFRRSIDRYAAPYRNISNVLQTNGLGSITSLPLHQLPRLESCGPTQIDAKAYQIPTLSHPYVNRTARQPNPALATGPRHQSPYCALDLL
jgi:hypothetical protein